MDLSAINLTFYLKNKTTELRYNQGDVSIFSYYTQFNKILKYGFILIKTGSKVVITNHSSIFKSYPFENGLEYYMKGEYKKPRKRLLNNICSHTNDNGLVKFVICN